MTRNEKRARAGGAQRGAEQPAREDTWEGKLSLNPRGFGFVTSPGREDVYVPPEAIGGALHGDRVAVVVVGRSPRGAEGRLVRIVARRPARVAGVLRRRGRSAWLEPDDTRLRGPIVLDPRSRDGRDGEAAVVAITRFPERADENPEGELVEVLGAPGDPEVEVAKILVREAIVEEHPPEAVAEAEAIARRGVAPGRERRVDLRSVPLPSIDPEDARDHDDAVWVERRGEGYRAWIAIADVSEYVTPGSALDAEARSRGCSIYLPDRAIPMLPHALSGDLCSLRGGVDRLCVCVVADLEASGKIRKVDIVEGVMRSAAMLTYGGVARTLGFTRSGPRSPEADALADGLGVLDELSRKLRRRRLERGALDLDLPEPRVELDPDTGAPVAVSRRAVDPGVKRAYQMIEELMLLGNEVVASWLTRRKSPAVYRIHGVPDDEKLARLGAVAETLGARVDVADLAEPGGAARFLRAVEHHPKRAVLEMILLRSLKQAQYAPDNVGHYGLASSCYVHFTSPIRRYPDLLVHRAVKRLLRGEKPDASAAAVEALAESAAHASARERAAMEVEREVVDLHRALFMRDKVGERYEGVVTGIGGMGAYVALGDPFVDVLVRFEALGPDRYEVTEDELALVGSRSGDVIALGDTMTVEIDDVAVLRRTVLAHRVVPAEVLARLDRDRPAPHPGGAFGRGGGPAGRRGPRPAGRAAGSDARRAPSREAKRAPGAGGGGRPSGKPSGGAAPPSAGGRGGKRPGGGRGGKQAGGGRGGRRR